MGNAPQAAPPATDGKADVITAARSTIGTPYRFGGSSPETGFDCSGLVCWTYEQIGISLPRRARDQHKFGIKVEKSQLEPGDIVVFKGTNSRTGWHSGIYTGDGMFVHSPTKGKTVTESSLNSAYFASRFAGARRIPRDGSASSLLAEFRKQEQKSAPAQQKGKTGKKNASKNPKKATPKKSGKTVAAAKPVSSPQTSLGKQATAIVQKLKEQGHNPSPDGKTVAKARKK